MPDIRNPLNPVEYPFNSLYNGGVFMRESTPRYFVDSAVIILSATGIMTTVLVPAFAGDVITNISVRFGTTGSATPTNWWFALYDTAATPALIGQTADQTSTVVSASTFVTKALVGGPFTLVTTGLYAVGIMFAGTIPTTGGKLSVANVGGGAQITGQKRITASSGSGLTTTAPPTAAPGSLNNTNGIPYIVLT